MEHLIIIKNKYVILKTYSIIFQNWKKDHFIFLKKYTVFLQKTKILYFFRIFFSENIHSENLKSPLPSWLFPRWFQMWKLQSLWKDHKDFNSCSKRPFHLSPWSQLRQQDKVFWIVHLPRDKFVYICRITTRSYMTTQGPPGWNLQTSLVEISGET